MQRGVAMALGLPVDFLIDLPGETMYHFRMIRYPPQHRLPPAEGQLGCGAHTDYGSVTLLTDDGVGGLQVMRRDGTWIDVDVPDDHVVVNLGDLMAIWTNDRYVSNPHRVINPPDLDRYSMPLFVTPPFHAHIECLDTCLAPGEVPARRADAGRAVSSRPGSTTRTATATTSSRSTTARWRRPTTDPGPTRFLHRGFGAVLHRIPCGNRVT